MNLDFVMAPMLFFKIDPMVFRAFEDISFVACPVRPLLAHLGAHAKKLDEKLLCAILGILRLNVKLTSLV